MGQPLVPLRLMHMVGAAKAGGAEMFALRLFKALHGTPGVVLHVLVRKNSWLAARLKEANVPHTELAFGGMFDLLTRFKAQRIAKAFQPHAITSWMNRATRFMPQGPWLTMARLGGYYNLKYYRGRAQVLAGNTEDICAYCIKNGWPEDRVVYLPNFVPDPPAGWQSGRADMRAKLGVKEGDCVLLQSGRLHTNKAVDIAISALARLPAHTHLVLAGHGPLEDELRSQAMQMGVASRVHFLGWVDDITAVAAAADIWLAPSRFEPLGNTVLDGWMHGLPVVAAASAGPVSLITTQENGVLVPVNDAPALADAVLALQSNASKARAMGVAGLASGRSRFGEKAVVDAYLGTYRLLIPVEEKEG